MFFQFLLLCFIFGVTSLVESKKYDVELEAYQLYGDNLAGVLAKFRKSADYIKILYKKAKDLRHELADVRVQILAYYEKKLKRQLQEMFGLNTVKTTKNPTSPERFRSRIMNKNSRRQGNQEIDEQTQKKIDRIDDYYPLNTYLTAKEKNEFKDLGFRYIRDVIRSIIEKTGFEGADGEVRSTLMREGRLKELRGTHKLRKDTTVSLESKEDKTRYRRNKIRALK